MLCVYRRIYIVDVEDDTPADAEIELYDPLEFDEFDEECGTFGSAEYAPADGESERVAYRKWRRDGTDRLSQVDC